MSHAQLHHLVRILRLLLLAQYGHRRVVVRQPGTLRGRRSQARRGTAQHGDQGHGRVCICRTAAAEGNAAVCDFCAQGIEKTFKRDKSVTKVDADLSSGKVLIAFATTAPIDREAIDSKILANGQNVTAVQILRVK